MGRGARQQAVAMQALDGLLHEDAPESSPHWLRIERQVGDLRSSRASAPLSAPATPQQWWESLRRDQPVSVIDDNNALVTMAAMQGAPLLDTLALMAVSCGEDAQLQAGNDLVTITRNDEKLRLRFSGGPEDEQWALLELPVEVPAKDFVARYGDLHPLDYEGDDGLRVRCDEQSLTITSASAPPQRVALGMAHLAQALDLVSHEQVRDLRLRFDEGSGTTNGIELARNLGQDHLLILRDYNTGKRFSFTALPSSEVGEWLFANRII